MSYRLVAPGALPAASFSLTHMNGRLSRFHQMTLLGLALVACAAATAQPVTSEPLAKPLVATSFGGSSENASAVKAPTLSLNQLVQAVVDHNPELRGVEQSRVTAQAAVVSAGALPNPKLEFSQGQNSARLPSTNPGTVQSYGISIPIELPGVRSARIGAAKAGERASVQQIEVTRNVLVAQVQLKAYEVVLRKAQAKAAYEAVRLLEQAHERVRVRVQSGEAPRYEIIKADAELINARQQEQSARLLAEQSLLTLNRLAAGHLPMPFELSLSLEDPVNVQALEATNQMSHPELQQLQTEIDRAQAQVDGARASRWPGVDLRVGHTREPDVRQNMIGVSVQIPLFDQRKGQIDEASSELERARLRLEGRQAELQQQIQLAWKSLEMAQTRTKALGQGAVREAEAALRVAEAAYRYGERGILDVLDAQRVLRNVRADLLEARYQLQAARIELDFLAGRFASSNVAVNAATNAR